MSWKQVKRFLPFDRRVDDSQLFADLNCPMKKEFNIESYYRFGLNQFKYKKDPDRKDVWQSATTTFKLRTGDCEDMSIWLCRAGYDLGHNPKLIIGAVIMGMWWWKKIPKYPNHAWVEHEGKVYDLTYMRTVKKVSMYGNTMQPMYAYDNEGKYVWGKAE